MRCLSVFMFLHETNLPGVFEVHLELILEERGFFAHTWCRKEISAHGLNSLLVQCDVSYNTRARDSRCHLGKP
jgi:dTDP-4-dehydrorhamnose 3,5-epimerase